MRMKFRYYPWELYQRFDFLPFICYRHSSWSIGNGEMQLVFGWLWFELIFEFGGK